MFFVVIWWTVVKRSILIKNTYIFFFNFKNNTFNPSFYTTPLFLSIFYKKITILFNQKMKQNPNIHPPNPNKQPNITSHIVFAGYKIYFNLLSSQNSPQIPYQGASFNLTSLPIQFPTSFYIQQNLFRQIPNLQQNLLPTFSSMAEAQATTTNTTSG